MALRKNFRSSLETLPLTIFAAGSARWIADTASRRRGKFLGIGLWWPELHDIRLVPDLIPHVAAFEARCRRFGEAAKSSNVPGCSRNTAAVIRMAVVKNQQRAHATRFQCAYQRIVGLKTIRSASFHALSQQIHACKTESDVARQIRGGLSVEVVHLHADSPKLGTARRRECRLRLGVDV
jgi:hypothetical protein